MSNQSIYLLLLEANDNAKVFIKQFKSGEIDKERLDKLLHEENLNFCDLAKKSQYALEQVMNALDFYVVARWSSDKLEIAHDILSGLIDQSIANGDLLVLFPYVCLPGYKTKFGYEAQIHLLRSIVL